MLPWVTVSPLKGTLDASPRTQISFLGVPAGDISQVSVRGDAQRRALRQARGLLDRQRRELRADAPVHGRRAGDRDRRGDGSRRARHDRHELHDRHLYAVPPPGGSTGATGTTGRPGATGATGATGSTGAASFVSEPTIHPPLVSRHHAGRRPLARRRLHDPCRRLGPGRRDDRQPIRADGLVQPRSARAPGRGPARPGLPRQAGADLLAGAHRARPRHQRRRRDRRHQLPPDRECAGRQRALDGSPRLRSRAQRGRADHRLRAGLREPARLRRVRRAGSSRTASSRRSTSERAW